MSNKERYIEWAAGQSDLPIFLQPWWLEAVCAGKHWDVLLCERDGEIAGAMPYLYRKRLRMRYVLMPQQTQLGGMWVDRARLDEAESICSDLVAQLDALGLSYYYQQYAPYSPFPNILSSKGFTVRERVTYRVEDLSDLDEVIRHFSKNKRRQLQKAQNAGLLAAHDMSAEAFYRFHARCMWEQGKDISYSREFLLVLERKAARLGQCRIVTIQDAQGEVHAAAFLVWDSRLLYYLIPCFSPRHKDSGAGALLVLEAMRLARELNRSFDFEGSMRPGIANHYRQFGSAPTLYYSVEKYYNRLFHIMAFINRIRNLRYRF